MFAAALGVVESADWQEAKVVTMSVGSSRKRDRISTNFRKGGGGPPSGLGGILEKHGCARRVQRVHWGSGGIQDKERQTRFSVHSIERVDVGAITRGHLSTCLVRTRLANQVKMGEEHTGMGGGGSTASSRVAVHTGHKPGSNPCKRGTFSVGSGSFVQWKMGITAGG